MIDKIGGTIGYGPRPSGTDGTTSGSAGTRERGQNTGASNVEQLSLTRNASQLQSLEQTVRSMSEVDEARVSETRAAIERGDYQVDSRKVAEKLLDFEAALFGKA